ncbi:MAG: glycogen debranching protein [Clostridium sp.]|nr:glycogen debranching protein [Clostridium sp.]
MRFGKRDFKNYDRGIEKEWLITNGRSGFAGTTIIGANSRKYHSLLNACLKSPDERYNVLPKIQESLILDDKEYPLTTTKYEMKVIKGYKNLQSFNYDGIPTYKYFVSGVFIEKGITMEYGKNTTIISYSISTNDKKVEVILKPCLSFKNPGKAGKEENLKFNTKVIDGGFSLIPEIKKDINIKIYSQENIDVSLDKKVSDKVFYDVDKRTGDVYLESYYTPGSMTINVDKNSKKTIYIIATIEDELEINPKEIFEASRNRIKKLQEPLRGDNRTIAKYLPLAADNFIVDRDSTKFKTILAGYPWFLDWGRDTMIALPGLTLVTKRFKDSREILKSFTGYEKDGLIPNMFPDNGEEPLYNTVDASLWYIHCIYYYLIYSGKEDDLRFVKENLYNTAKKIIESYKNGTKFSIKMGENYLINAGSGLDQVTWMDVRSNGIVVTPRHGAPVEINALWYNALNIMNILGEKFEDKDSKLYKELAEKVKESFNREFWNDEEKCLYDVVKGDEKDNTIRPNQIWAVSLPFTMLSDEKEKLVVNKVLKELYTPYGLRSLNRGHEDYHKEYIGELFKRDLAYHQGTTWSFPLGAFMTAYCKVNNYSEESVEFVDELLKDMETHIEDECLGSIAEIFDGDTPHLPRGCYAQAWGVGEILRVYYECVLGKNKELIKNYNKLFG